MKNKISKKKEWELVALEAMGIAFDHNGVVSKSLKSKDKTIAISLLYKAINNLNADLCWPFIKLADLIDDEKEKIKLHIRAYTVEDNIYSIKFLFKQLLKDHPAILNQYFES